jgi:hypothetical protein
MLDRTGASLGMFIGLLVLASASLERGPHAPASTPVLLPQSLRLRQARQPACPSSTCMAVHLAYHAASALLWPWLRVCALAYASRASQK